MAFRAGAALVLCAAVAGCDPDDVGERLELTLGSAEPVELDTGCAGDACMNSVALTLEYPPDYLASETVELDQYRVDYELVGVQRAIPYYAEPLAIALAPGGSETVELTLLGDAQLAAIVGEVESETVRGTVHVTFAGYDHDGQQVFPELDIDVVLRSSSGAEQTGDDESSTTDGGDGQ